MEAAFDCLPIESVVAANILVSAVATLFLIGAPVLPRLRPLKLSYICFWIIVLLYYVGRLPLLYMQPRLYSWLSPWHASISDSYWLSLVVLADLSVIALILGAGVGLFGKNRRYFWFAIIVIALFISAWISAALLHHNVASSLLTFAAFLWIGWTCRLKHIASSVIWITYSMLHVPIRLTAHSIGPEYSHTIFVLLLVTKLSLIAAMYATLEVNGKVTRKKMQE